MMAISEFPRCSAYLKGMGVKLFDPEMQDKHFAWLLGDAASYVLFDSNNSSSVNSERRTGDAHLTEDEYLRAACAALEA